MSLFRHVMGLALPAAAVVLAAGCSAPPTPRPVPGPALPSAAPPALPLILYGERGRPSSPALESVADSPVSPAVPVDRGTPTPGADQAVLTEDEAARQTLLLLDPAREPRVEWVRMLPARVISAAWGTAYLRPFGYPGDHAPDLSPSDEPMVVVRASTLGLRTEAMRLIAETDPVESQQLSGSTDHDCQPPPPPDQRESIVAVYSARSGVRVASAVIHPREATVLARLDGAPEAVASIRTPSPTPTPEPPFISIPLRPTFVATARPTVDVPNLSPPQRLAVDTYGLTERRWWRYDRVARYDGYKWAHEVVTTTVSDLWQEQNGDVVGLFRTCVSGPAVVGIEIYGDGCQAYYPIRRLTIERSGRARRSEISGSPPADVMMFPLQPGSLPADSDLLGSVRRAEDIAVPAGRFEGCHVIETIVTDGSWDWEWLCPGYGSVRREHFDCGFHGQLIEVTELLASGTADGPVVGGGGDKIGSPLRVTVTVPEPDPR